MLLIPQISEQNGMKETIMALRSLLDWRMIYPFVSMSGMIRSLSDQEHYSGKYEKYHGRTRPLLESIMEFISPLPVCLREHLKIECIGR
jgi:hypothetical protein